MPASAGAALDLQDVWALMVLTREEWTGDHDAVGDLAQVGRWPHGTSVVDTPLTPWCHADDRRRGEGSPNLVGHPTALQARIDA